MTTETTEPAARKPASPRRLARELAAQVLYGWILNPRDAADLRTEVRDNELFPKADGVLVDRLIDGVTARAAELRERLQPCLDRRVADLSPVEHAILLIGAEEMTAHPETPYRVIINEAVELAKTFGGTDGHKYVNGVLDRLGTDVRPGEARRR